MIRTLVPVDERGKIPGSRWREIGSLAPGGIVPVQMPRGRVM